VLLQRASKYRLEPTEQAAWLAQVAGSCRYVYNIALEQRRDHWRKGKLGYVQQARELTDCRVDTDWLAACPVHALQCALRDLDAAFQRFFAGLGGYPQPRRKHRGDSFRLPDPSYLGFKRLSKRMGAVKLPKIGWIKCRDWRPLGGELRNVTISKRGKHWYASIQWQREVDAPAASNMPVVGIDRGVAVFAALSNGTKIEPLNAFKRTEERLAKAQRKLARKTKFSANWNKQKAKISRSHIHAADARKDFLHKHSTEIAKSHGIVKVEKLQVRNMSASAKGTVEEPGKNVKAKSGLNRSILDQGWSTFSTMLKYKLAERGGELVEVDPAYTSQTCAECGVIDAASRNGQATFSCTTCGHEDNADVNAARNIMAARTLAPKPPKRTLRRVGKRNQTAARAAGKECGHAVL
jgi:putative transposase